MCWHRIKNDEDNKCPNCREPYGDEPYKWGPLTPEQEVALKELRSKEQNSSKIPGPTSPSVVPWLYHHFRFCIETKASGGANDRLGWIESRSSRSCSCHAKKSRVRCRSEHSNRSRTSSTSNWILWYVLITRMNPGNFEISCYSTYLND